MIILSNSRIVKTNLDFPNKIKYIVQKGTKSLAAFRLSNKVKY